MLVHAIASYERTAIHAFRNAHQLQLTVAQKPLAPGVSLGFALYPRSCATCGNSSSIDLHDIGKRRGFSRMSAEKKALAQIDIKDL